MITTTTEIITKAVSFGASIHPCFFGLSNTSVCNPEYIITNSFSLGEAVAAFGLALAVFQLRNHQWDIVLNIRVSPKIINNVPWYLCLLGGLSILWAVLLPSTPWLGAPVLGYPVIFEILGAILLVLPPTLLWLLSRPNSKLFNPNNARRFSETIQRQATKFTSENIDFCIQLVYLNLEPITNAIQKYSSDTSTQDEEIKKTCGDAELILDTLLSHKIVVGRIATTRLDFIGRLITLANSKQVTYDLSAAIGPIVAQLYNNPDSYFYTQIERYKYKYAPNIYQLFFKDPNVLSVDPYAMWGTQYRKTLNELLQQDYLDAYLKTLELGFETYFEHSPRMGDYRIFYRAFGSSHGYDGLIGYLNAIASHRQEYKDNKPLKDLVDAKIWATGFFFEYTIPDILQEAYAKGRMKTEDYNYLNKDNYQEYPVGVFVGAICDFIDFLSKYENDESGILRARELVEKLLPYEPGEHPPFIKKMGELFKTLIWEKIEENIQWGVYPATLKMYIGLFAYRPATQRVGTPYSTEQEKVIDFMYTVLKPKLTAGALMMNGHEKMEDVFLPHNVRFNHSTEKFELLDHYGQATIIEEKPTISPKSSSINT